MMFVVPLCRIGERKKVWKTDEKNKRFVYLVRNERKNLPGRISRHAVGWRGGAHVHDKVKFLYERSVMHCVMLLHECKLL